MDPMISFILAVVFAGAYMQVRVPSRRRSGGGLARLILIGGASVWLLYGLYELNVQAEYKPENVPIRVDMLFIGPALIGLLILGVVAYIYGLGGSEVGSAPRAPPGQRGR